jgi:hypothetical protein
MWQGDPKNSRSISDMLIALGNAISLRRQKMKKQILHLAIGCALAIAFMLTTGRATFGDPGGDCHNRLEADRARIDRDAARHGQDSPSVRHDVDRMEADRQWCRDHHADWDHNRFDIGIYVRH